MVALEDLTTTSVELTVHLLCAGVLFMCLRHPLHSCSESCGQVNLGASPVWTQIPRDGETKFICAK